MTDTLEAELTLDAAREQIERISVHRAQLVAGRIALNQRLERSQREAGRRYLAGDRDALREAAELRTELEAVEGALVALDEDAELASVSLERAKASDLRGQAQQKRIELSELEEKTQKLLGQLGALEGVLFDSAILSAQPVRNGAWIGANGQAFAAPWLSVLELGLNRPDQRPLAVPKSRRLRAEIEDLELRAEGIDQALERAELKHQAAETTLWRGSMVPVGVSDPDLYLARELQKQSRSGDYSFSDRPGTAATDQRPLRAPESTWQKRAVNSDTARPRGPSEILTETVEDEDDPDDAA